MKYLLIIREDDELPAEEFVWDHMNPEHVSVENIQAIHQWHQMAVTILSDSSDSTITYTLNVWMNENRIDPIKPKGALLWWTRNEEDTAEEEEESFGPVTNPDGSPTEFTKQMLEGTGRSLTPLFNFEDEHLEASYEERTESEGAY